jgi:hypothetical protein
MNSRDYQTLHLDTQLKCNVLVKEHQLYCCSTFHSLGRVFNNGNNPYHKVSMKRSLTCSWAVLLTSVDKRYIWVSLSFWCQLMHKMLLPDSGTSTRKQNNTGEANTVIIVSNIALNVWSYKYRKKQRHVNTKKTRQLDIVWSGLN